MFELASIPPVVQGGIIVTVILVLAVGLYVGYATVERFFGDRILQAIDDA